MASLETFRIHQPYLAWTRYCTKEDAMPSPKERSREYPGVEEQIEAVETGLLPAVLIRGRRQRMTLEERMAHYSVPGVSVAVINDHRIEWAKGYGVLEAGGTQSVDSGTLFLAASITKPVAAMAALRLVERGLLELDENVNKRLVSWKLPENDLTVGRPVTLRWLLSHRAGLSAQRVFGHSPGSERPTLLQILDGIPPSPNPPVRVEKVPGEVFEYSNFGYCIVELLLEDVAGCPFPDLMRDSVLRPLAMNDSTFERPLPEDLRDRAARAHGADGGPIPDWFLGEEMAAAGGLWTTPSDVARFAIEIQLAYAGRSRKVLSPGTIREVLTPQRGGPVGLGPFIEGSGPSLRFLYSGTGEGYQCELVAYASRGQGAVVMTNSDNGHMLVTEILGAVAAVYGWPDFLVEKTVVDVAPALLERYVGEYDLGLLKITVSIEDNRLFAETEWYGKHELYPESEREFFLIDLPAHFAFVVDSAGRAQELVLRAWGAELRGKRK
jgi:CubicO group peptidase (beta-lactamase class C family)